MHVTIARDPAFDESIQVKIDGLPFGVSVDPLVLEAHESTGTLTVVAPPTVGVPDPNAAKVRGYVSTGTRSDPIELTVRGAPGSLDTSFGTNGYAGVAEMHYFYDVLELEDGSLLVTGLDETYVMTVARKNPDGSPATTFGINGRARVEAGRNGYRLVATESHIYVIGDSHGPGLLIARLTHDGQLDTSFANGGSATIALPKIFVTEMLLIDGQLVIVGGKVDRAYITRINLDGSLDHGFGTDAITQFGDVHATDLIQLEDGRFAAAAGRRIFVFHPDGIPDSSFGTDGAVEVPFSDSQRTVSTVAQANETLLAAGEGMAVARITLSGSVELMSPPLDFGASADEPLSVSAADMALLDDGAVVLAGNALGMEPCMGAGRRLSDLDPDPSFGDNGSARFCGGAAASEIEILHDGRYVFAGNTNYSGGRLIRIWD